MRLLPRFRRRRRVEVAVPVAPEGAKDRLSPDGLRIVEFPAPVQNMLRLYGVGGSYAQLYAHQPNVRTAVQTIAREAAELSLKMYLKTDRGPTKPSSRVEVAHPMIELLREPTPGESVYRFWFALFADLEIYDVAYWLKLRVGGRVRALRRVPPSNLIPIRDPLTYAVTYFRTANGTVVLPRDLVAFWGYDPGQDHGYIAPMESIRRIIAEDLAAGLDREGRWRNSARKEGVIERALDSPLMSDTAKEAFLLDAEDSLGGPTGSGRMLVLEPGMHYVDSQWSPREMEYINARKLSRLEVAAHFHIPPAMIAASANNSEASRDTLAYFYRSSLPPRLSRVENEIEAQLLPDFEADPDVRRDFYVEFNLDAKLRGSFEEQAQIIATAAGGPVITVNEARARLNLPPIPGGDLIFVPLNSMRAGGPQAGSQSPVETPANRLEPVGTTPGGGTAPQGAASRPLAPGKAIADLLAPEAESVEDVLAKVEARAVRFKEEGEHAAFLRETRARFEERHSEVLRRYFSRQSNQTKTSRPVLVKDRWDRELSDDLFGVQFQNVSAVGEDAAKRLGGEFDSPRTGEYLKVRTAAIAENINASTKERLGAEEDAAVVFSDERATSLAMSLTAFATGWAVQEAASQLGTTKAQKTWTVTSGAPRASHADVDGETVAMDETFSNGLAHPGDPAGDVSEVAGCTCVMTVST